MNIQLLKKLPQEIQTSFEEIDTGKVLGASNHIKMIANMFCVLSENEGEAKASSLISEVSLYFKETRGKSSYAIITALNQIEQNIADSQKTSYSEKVKDGVNTYFENADKNTKKVIELSCRVLEKTSTVMIFDYSSTVEKALIACPKKLKVIIPESRVIQGGYPFVKSCVEKGHDVHFIPDANMLTVLKEVDAVLIGAETFYPDGTAFNTAGSDILAELAFIYHIPYYVLTPLLKVDLRPLDGVFKEPIIRDEKESLGKDWPEELKNKVDFKIIELTAINPKLITKYITEKGIVCPEQLYTILCGKD